MPGTKPMLKILAQVIFVLIKFCYSIFKFFLRVIFVLLCHSFCFLRWCYKKIVSDKMQRPWLLPPPISLLTPIPVSSDMVLSSDKELAKKGQALISKLADFGISGCIVNVQKGTLVDLFEFLLTTKVKVSKILALENDLAMVLKSSSVRIIAPIPGKNLIGFEVAKKTATPIYYANILHKQVLLRDKPLQLVIGQRSDGVDIVLSLVDMPHLLIAGSTGSGKSVCIHSLIASLLFGYKPSQLQLVLIDPKQLEFAFYKDIPHLLFPVVIDIPKALTVLQWLVQEMMDRYTTLSSNGFRDLGAYNLKSKKKLPYIVVVIDELADLIMVAGKTAEHLLIRLAQMARAAGIHLIVATQRPSVDVVTGLIKVNFPTRIAFRVSSKIDSRVILDVPGAEKLLGRGDMFFMHPSSGMPIRLTGSFISAQELEKLTIYLRKAGKPCYINLEKFQEKNRETLSHEQESDQLFSEVVNFLKEREDISISLIQRKFKIGFNRAARIIEKLEMEGFIGAASKSSKARKIL